jgi:very-short-patch-repair endonuclease
VFLRAGAHHGAEGRLAAACFFAGAQALASHRSAANLWGLKVEEVGAEVSTELGVRREAAGLIVHRSSDLAPGDRRVRRGIPVTSQARTLVDLASCLDEEALAFVVEEAWRRQIAAPDWVERRLEQLGGRGRPGAKSLASVLADCRRREHPLESALEVRLWRLLVRSKLPLPDPGYPFHDDHGHPARIDFAYPAARLALEADGFEFHGTRAAFERDRLRTARLSAQGWRVLPVTWRQLEEQPTKVLARIRQALEFGA